MPFHWIDVIFLILFAVLGVKGFLRGAVREIFALLGIGLGIFLGSRFALEMGKFAQEKGLFVSGEGAMKLVGFVIIFAIVWGFFFLLGFFISKLLRKKDTPVRVIARWADRIGGFFISSGKYFLIISVIFFALAQTAKIGNWLEANFSGSFFYTPLIKTGGFLMKLEESSAIKESVEKTNETIETIENARGKIMEIQNNAEELIDSANETFQNSTKNIGEDDAKK
ncbi:MAG: CvpA family protein [Helicobacteraceae bacterium]|jgi:membrane protein required for colicin V production|nr:CvpA family protein [Helicobacteraceae bacterium]